MYLPSEVLKSARYRVTNKVSVESSSAEMIVASGKSTRKVMLISVTSRASQGTTSGISPRSVSGRGSGRVS